jgi:NAD(P)-dependent dehydrogenase (short-subunit alcohol dehydrogenase family)
VAVNYAASRRLAEGAVRTIRAQGGRAVAVQADVSDPQAVSDMFRHVERVLGPVQVLVNNAGVTKFIPFAHLDRVASEDWQRILGINLVGAFLCAQAAAPGMLARGGGKIVNISSDSAFTAHGSSIPYVVSKAALVSLTQCLARALAPTVQVNGVAPGWMLTPWIEKYLPPAMGKRVRAEGQAVPVEDVADAVAHLLTNDSITGQVLVIDQGGMWK